MNNNPDLAAAIYAARSNPANASFFASTPSNYLIGLVNKGQINTQQLSTIASTGTFNIQTNSGFYNVGSNLQATQLQPPSSLSNTRNNASNPAATLPPGSTSSSPNNPSTSTNSLTDSFNSGVHQVESFFTAHPVAIIGIGALIALLVFKK